MCSCNVYLCSYFFIQRFLSSPKYPPLLFIFCYLERLCLYNMEISLAVLLIQTGKTNMTNNRDKIVKGKKKKIDMIFLPYRPPLLGTVLTALHKLHWNHFPKLNLYLIEQKPETLKTDTKKRKYCSSLSKLNVHYAKYRKEILNIELGVGVYMNVFLRGTVLRKV